MAVRITHTNNSQGHDGAYVYRSTSPMDPQALPAPICPAPLNEAEVSGPSRLEPDGTVVITAPTIDRSQVDEIIGERAVIYPVAIPRNTFTVEVPAR